MLGDLDRRPRYFDSYSCIRNMTQDSLTQSFWAPRAVRWLGDPTQSPWLSVSFKAPPGLSPHPCSDPPSLPSSHWPPFLPLNGFPPLCCTCSSFCPEWSFAKTNLPLCLPTSSFCLNSPPSGLLWLCKIAVTPHADSSWPLLDLLPFMFIVLWLTLYFYIHILSDSAAIFSIPCWTLHA